MIDNLPLVSIITPLYCCEKYIAETIMSVQNQSYTNYEHIVVDDCSTDNSYAIVNELSKNDSRIKLLKNEKNSRVAYTRNRALDVANGDYILFLDSDDILVPQALEILINLIRSNNYSIVTGPYQKMSEDGSKLYGVIIPPECVDYKDMLKTCTMPFMTTMIRRDVVGNHRLKNIHHEDYFFWLNILSEGHKCYGFQDFQLGYYRLTANSLSRNKFKTFKYQWNIYKNELKFGNIKSLYYFMFYATKGLIKYFK